MPQTYATFADDCFAGKSVLITGAASGMGLETARAFSSKSAEVVMADRDEGALERYGDELRQSGGKIHTVKVDVSDPESLASVFDFCDANIVCIASDAGVHGGGGLIADTAYAASKAGTLSVVKSVARELAGKKIRINALNPGPTDSPMHSHIDQALKDKIAASLPMRRMGRADDMAATIMFLCSGAASFTYGAAFDVDGGSMLR